MISKDNIHFEVIKQLDYKEENDNEEIKFFTDFNVKRSIYTPTNFGKPIIISNSNACIDINNCKVIDTIKGTSLEGQHLSSKKLLILGNVIFTLYFFIPYICDHLFHVDEIVPFSVFIIVPGSTKKEGIFRFKYMIEDVTSTLINKHKLFFNVSIFIQYLNNP
ncbi:DUF3794 domain-containing protein [Clostridium psychrophilum]|uniref:DUF3794 domain-containing protein n=1 Tax=Clostridium psychrophilum TaxID=132926 RepID=UPI001C0B9988|nr:DUF3794 domain-containing protein [Clostridium psychrophilum]MBU3179976.1 DUF3794 domain-containing protein [Clostridium psychrophilum]